MIMFVMPSRESVLKILKFSIKENQMTSDFVSGHDNQH